MQTAAPGTIRGPPYSHVPHLIPLGRASNYRPLAGSEDAGPAWLVDNLSSSCPVGGPCLGPILVWWALQGGPGRTPPHPQILQILRFITSAGCIRAGPPPFVGALQQVAQRSGDTTR